MPTKPILELEHVSKSFFSTRALSDLSFSIAAGEIRALVGENGAGKSTFIKIISGVYQPDAGAKISFEGKALARMSPELSLRLGIAVIYQDFALFPNLSVAENIAKGPGEARRFSRQKTEAAVQGRLQHWGIELDPAEKVGRLSLGKQQLVAICRAIFREARVIIMDEPTSALSASETEKLLELVKRLKQEGIAVIYVSHKLGEIFEIADSVSVLRDGCLVKTAPTADFSVESMIKAMVGRDVDLSPLRSEREPSEEPVFELSDFSDGQHFEGVSLSLKKYEILALTGLVGAGRSELMQAAVGLRPHVGGRVRLHGRELRLKSYDEALAEGICYLPEDRLSQGLFAEHDVKSNISAAHLDSICRGGLLSRAAEAELGARFVRQLDIKPGDTGMAIRYLSGGNQQKAMLSRMLNAQPKLLIVDEPTAGVDVGTKYEIYKLLRALAAQGVGIILVSSDLPEVLTLSDRIAVMCRGRLSGELRGSEATQEAVMRLAFLGKGEAS